MLSETSMALPPPSPLRHRHQTFSESVLQTGNSGTSSSGAAAAAAADDDRMSTISDAMMPSNRQSMLFSPRYRPFMFHYL
jgi:hypothetical protein